MQPEDRRRDTRRLTDSLRYWVPLIMSLVSTMLALGFAYGALGGRLDLIEYRLQQIEQHVTTGR